MALCSIMPAEAILFFTTRLQKDAPLCRNIIAISQKVLYFQFSEKLVLLEKKLLNILVKIMSAIKNFLKKLLPPDFILWTHKARAVIAAYWYGFPARELKVIGITGTNGKTTTCHLITKILEEAGYKVGMATTINFKIGERVFPNETKMTTVSPFLLQKLLRDMARAGCHYAVIETTSHAIAQYRNWGINYEITVLTNITHEHLDYHKTYEEYREVKTRLFAHSPKVSVINLDDRAGRYFLDLPAYQHFTYGLDAQGHPEQSRGAASSGQNKPDILGRKLVPQPDGIMFTAVTPMGQLAVDLKIPGTFNVYNALAAIAVGISQGIGLEIIKFALESVTGVPGRMEKIEAGQDFLVYIDYAHTPDALEQIYKTLKPVAKGKIISVFGAAGDRDKTKRPIMGALGGKYADYVIITNEDPYTEDPMAIIEQVADGVPRGRPLKRGAKGVKKEKGGEGVWWWKILDRREAIKKAFALAREDDIVLITGKGAETSMAVGDKKIPWSDKKVILELLQEK